MSIEVAVRPEAETPSSVEAKVLFTARGPDKLYAYTYKPPEGTPATNITAEPHTVRVANLRQAAPHADLDVEGFQLVRHRTSVADFWDEAQTMALGHPETAELVKAATGAARVVVFDHTFAAARTAWSTGRPAPSANRRAASTSTRRCSPARSACAR